MSANNQLIILKKKEGYEVHEHFCVDNEFIPSKKNLLDNFKTLEDAINFANNYCRKNMVEYGYHIELSEDKEKNPAEFCLNCNKYLGFKGFCSKECHDEWYDKNYPNEESLSDLIEDIGRGTCCKVLYLDGVKEFIKKRINWFDRILKQYKVGGSSGTTHIQFIKDIEAEKKRLIKEVGEELLK